MGGGGSKESEKKAQSPQPPKNPEGLTPKPPAAAPVSHSAPPRMNGTIRGSMAPLSSVRNGTMNATLSAMNGDAAVHGAEKLRGKKNRVQRLIQAAGNSDDDEGDDDDGKSPLGNTARTSSNVAARGADRSVVEGTEIGGMSSPTFSPRGPKPQGSGAFNQGGELVTETTINGRKQMTFMNNDAELDDGKATSALARLQTQGRAATLQTDILQRKQSIANGNVRAMSAKSTDGSTVTEVVVNGTSKMKILLEAMRQFRQTLRAKRDMSDADIEEIRAQQEQYAKNKASMTQQITEIGKKIDVVGRANKEPLIEFVDSLIKETEARQGNVELLSVILQRVINMDWAEQAKEKGWAIIAAKDGSARFLDLILTLPEFGNFTNTDEYSEMLADLLQTAVSNTVLRTNLVAVIVKNGVAIRIGDFSSRLSTIWQRFMTELCSQKRQAQSEDRGGRVPLITKIVQQPTVIPIDYDLEDASDGHTIVTRAVEEGDTLLITTLLKQRVKVTWDRPLRIKGVTPLGIAIDSRNKAMLDLLLTSNDISVTSEVESSGMTAVEYARETGAGPLIIQALERKALKESSPALNGSLRRLGSTLGASVSGSTQNGRKTIAVTAAPITKTQKLPRYLTENTDEYTDVDIMADIAKHKSVNATQRVGELLFGLWHTYDDVRDLSRSMTRDANAAAEYVQLRDSLPRLKQEIARSIMALGERLTVEGADVKNLVANSVDRLIQEQDEEANLDLIKVLTFRVVTVDFAPPLSEHRWPIIAADGSQSATLAALLRIPKLWKEEREVADLLAACVQNPKRRLSLCNVFLKFHETLRVGTHKNFLQPSFDELWELLATPSKLQQSDDLFVRPELLHRFFYFKNVINIRTEHEFAQSLTYFTRACREGDVELVRAMLNMCMVPNINRIFTNKSNALMQAVIGNQHEVVKILLNEPDIDITYKSPHGTALDLAVSLKKDPALVNTLKAAVASLQQQQAIADGRM